MRRALPILIIVLVAAGLGLYFYFEGREYTFRFTESQLYEKLTERTPVRKTYLFIFQVELNNPRIMLLDGSDRVNAGLDITLNIRINEEPLPLGGEIDVSGGVRYEGSEGQFFLTDPIVENLSVQGIPADMLDRVYSALTVALGEYYADRPIYTLRASDLKQAAAKLLLKNVVVQNQELVITLGI